MRSRACWGKAASHHLHLGTVPASIRRRFSRILLIIHVSRYATHGHRAVLEVLLRLSGRRTIRPDRTIERTATMTQPVVPGAWPR